MDDFVRDKLVEWNFLEQLGQSFDSNEIDENTFNNLDEEDLKELIPILAIRKRFKSRYQQYRTISEACDTLPIFSFGSSSSTITNCSDTSDTSTASTNQDTSTASTSRSHANDGLVILESPYTELGTHHEPNECERYINQLMETRGKDVLASHKKQRLHRSKLCRIIIEEEFNNSSAANRFKISSSRFEDLASAICKVFPGESKTTYYVPYTRGCNGPLSARGMLWDKYINTRRVYRKVGVIPHKADESVNISKNLDWSHIDTNESIIWLTNNIEPYSEVEKHWKATTLVRLGYDIAIHEYTNKFKALRLPTGYLLLAIDFENKFPNLSNKLFEEWPSLSKKIIEFGKAQQRDNTIKTFFSNYEESTLNEHGEVVAFLLLPLLLGVTNVKSKKQGNHWRPNKAEVQRGFILHVQSADEINVELERRISKLERFQLQNQPIPIIVGGIDDITSALVVVNDIKYTVPTVLKAIDITFKTYHALNANYPPECEHVWMFVQRFVYGINTQHDKNFVSVNKLVSDLKLN